MQSKVNLHEVVEKLIRLPEDQIVIYPDMAIYRMVDGKSIPLLVIDKSIESDTFAYPSVWNLIDYLHQELKWYVDIDLVVSDYTAGVKLALGKDINSTIEATGSTIREAFINWFLKYRMEN